MSQSDQTMPTSSQRRQLCQLILEIGKLEKKIEAVRQLLCENPNFAPYTAFTRLDSRQCNSLSVYDLKQFMVSNNSTVTLTACELFIRLHDSDGDSELSFYEFLNAILPQDSPDLLNLTLQRDFGTLIPGEKMDCEIEFTLVKLIDWETKGVKELEVEKYSLLNSIPSGVQSVNKFLANCFYLIDADHNGTFSTYDLEKFFRLNQQIILPEDLQSFFRFSNKGNGSTIMLESFLAAIDVGSHQRQVAIKQSATERKPDQPLGRYSFSKSDSSFASFGQPSERNNFNKDLESLSTNTFTPKKAKGGISYEISTSKRTRSVSQKSSNYTPPFSSQKKTSTLHVKPVEKNLGKARVREELQRQIMMKKLQQKTQQQLQQQQQKQQSDKKLSSSQRDFSDDNRISYSHLLKKIPVELSSSGNKKQIKEIHAVGGNVAQFRVPQNYFKEERQSLLEFKQDIRGQLATSKERHENSHSPIKSVKFNSLSKVFSEHKSSKQNSVQKQLNFSNCKKTSSTKKVPSALRQSANKGDSNNKKLNSSHSQICSQLHTSAFELSGRSSRENSANKLSRSSVSIKNEVTPIKMQQYSSSKKQQNSSSRKRSEEKQNQQEQRLNRSSAKKTPLKGLRANISHHLCEYFITLAAISKKLERAKQELARQEDFNLFDAFKILDDSEKGVITAYNIEYFLQQQNLTVSLPEIILFLKRYDSNKIGALKFSEFQGALISSQDGYSNLLSIRKGSGIVPSINALSKETLRLFTKLIMEHLSSEYQLEVIRQSISKDRRWDYEYAFDLLNQRENGFVDIFEVKVFLELQNCSPSEREAKSIIQRFDKDGDKLISLPEFVTELSPSSLG